MPKKLSFWNRYRVVLSLVPFCSGLPQWVDYSPESRQSPFSIFVHSNVRNVAALDQEYSVILTPLKASLRVRDSFELFLSAQRSVCSRSPHHRIFAFLHLFRKYNVALPLMKVCSGQKCRRSTNSLCCNSRMCFFLPFRPAYAVALSIFKYAQAFSLPELEYWQDWNTCVCSL